MSCYNFDLLTFDAGLFDSTIDATYIVHLEGNGRYENIITQINEYKPTKNVYILLNKGYKKCKKLPHITNSCYDLIDANIYIFNDAEKKSYKNILVLEDDFIFSKEIKSSEHIKNINSFIKSHTDKKFLYLLGTVPLLYIPYNKYNFRTKSLGTHCVVFSKKLREHILLTHSKKRIKDWDFFNNSFMNKFTYHKPLCYQLLGETENYSFWGMNHNTIIQFLTIIPKSLIKFHRLDKQVEPGYSNLYTLSKYIFYIVVIIVVILLIIMCRKRN